MAKAIPFKKSKLYEAITTLSQKQLNDLTYFVNFSGSDLTIRQKDALLEMIDKLSNRQLIEENAIKNKFYKKDPNYWPKAKTHMLRVIYRYLKFSALENDKFIADYCLLNYFVEKKCLSNLIGLYKQVEIRLANQDYADTKLNSLETTLLADFKLLFTRTNRTISSVEILENITSDLSEFYVNRQLIFFMELLSRNLRVTGKSNNKKKSEINYLMNYKTHNIEIEIRKCFIKLLTAKNKAAEDVYDKTYKLIIGKANHLSKTTLYEFIIHLNNYCSDKLNKGYYGYSKMAWKNYSYLINNKLLETWALNPIAYINIILIGLKNRKLKLVNDYVNKLEPFIDNSNPKIKTAAITIAKTLKLYDKANSKPKLYHCLNQLLKFETNDLIIKYQHDKLKAKILFDLELRNEIIEMIENNIKLYKKHNRRVYNFFVVVETYIQGKTIKNLKPVNYHFSDFDWLRKRQQNQ